MMKFIVSFLLRFLCTSQVWCVLVFIPEWHKAMNCAAFISIQQYTTTAACYRGTSNTEQNKSCIFQMKIMLTCSHSLSFLRRLRSHQRNRRHLCTFHFSACIRFCVPSKFIAMQRITCICMNATSNNRIFSWSISPNVISFGSSNCNILLTISFKLCTPHPGAISRPSR